MKYELPQSEESATSIVGALFVCSILASVVLISAGGWAWFQKFLENSAPAWVQAVGSVVAILAAVYVSRAQIASDRAIEKARLAEDERRRLLVVDALLGAFQNAVSHTKRHFDAFPGMPMYPYYLDLLRTRADALVKIDLFECPASVIEPLLMLFPSPADGLIDPLLSYAKSFDDLKGDPKSHVPLIGNSFTTTLSLIWVARSACKASLEANAGVPSSGPMPSPFSAKNV